MKPRHNYHNSSRGFGPLKHQERKNRSAGWEHVSAWYDGMVGDDGSRFHQHYAIPTVLKLLKISSGTEVLDIGCGQGVLAPYVYQKGGHYSGIDASPSLIRMAQHRHGHKATFICSDARTADKNPQLKGKQFDFIIFMLSIQDIRNLRGAIAAASALLRPGGNLIIFMTHPAFRIPRQSGWGFDEKRQLVFRRIDSYLSTLDVPLRIDRRGGAILTRSYHRPLSHYIEALIDNQLAIDAFIEIPEEEKTPSASKAELRIQSEIPLFLALRAVKLPTLR